MATIDGTPGDDAGATALVGTNGDDTINGLAGNDELFGLDGTDTLNGGDDNDLLDGGAGDDYLDGGVGIDTASYAHANDGVGVDIGPGNGHSEGADGFDTLINIENIIGSAFIDDIAGSNDANVLDGGAGNDFLVGRGGDDVLIGGDGDDFVEGDDGNDSLFGGDGDDFFRPGAGDDVIDGGAGFDRVSHYGAGSTGGVTVSLLLPGVVQDTGQGLETLTGVEALSGTRFDDTLIGDNNSNWLIAADGTDTLVGNGGDDLLDVQDGELGPTTGSHVLNGGSGNDTAGFTNVNLDPSGVTVSLALQGVAQDTGHGMMTLSNLENLSGSQNDDALTGDAGANILAGNAGDDTLMGGDGNDQLYGDGAIVADTRANDGLSGPVTFFSDVTSLDPLLVDGNDTLDGGAGDDVMNGGGGNDTASFASWTEAVTVSIGTGGNGFATNDAGTENDTLISIENISGSAFNDFINGNNDANVLTGGDGGDALFGRGGDDILIGGNGNDFLRGSDGADTLDGGAGYDRVSSFVPTPTAGIHFDLNIQGVAQDTGQGMDTLIGIEHASGTTLGDTLIGNGGDNWLWDGSDGVAGGGTGDDTLTGGAGNDVLETGGGNDTLDGGTGTDTLSFLGGHVEISAAGVTYSLALQGAAQDTEQGMMNTSGLENVSGSLFDDSLTGNSGANIILGDFGNDTLSGGDGNDTLYGDGRIWVDTADSAGGSGPIALFGEADDGSGPAAGNDTLIGGRGNDTLYGGRGNDVMTGNQNDDRFVIEANSGNDRITDFGNTDKIVFQGVSGVDDFSDLTLTKVGSNTVITWGTGDSLQVDGYKPNQLHASDFQFTSSASSVLSLSSEAPAGHGLGHSALHEDLAVGLFLHSAIGGDLLLG